VIDQPVSMQMQRMMGTLGGFTTWATSAALQEGLAQPGACDFLFGNPHDVATPAYVDALTRATQPTGPDHYAYKMNEREATEAVAAGLQARFGLPFDSNDVFMTNGNFAGLAICLRLLVDPGDEVIFVSPPWFFYEALITGSGATPVRVHADRATYELDLEVLAAAITPRTRAVIVNSPNNPTGRIYPADVLDALAVLLGDASGRHGRRIYLLSDEAYNRIVFDDRDFSTPVAHYPHAFLLYTYAKTLLAPGSRLGYVALPPSMPERDALRDGMLVAQIATGLAFPVAPLQYAVPELDRLAVDLKSLQRRRDLLCSALRDQGYDLVVPEGAFYITVRSPIPDDMAFCEGLADHGVFVLPGAMFELPGSFRISVTASDEMVERAIPRFGTAVVSIRA
jgi:aspartate aminotransferase